MSSLTDFDKSYLESILGMESGYVLGFSDHTFGLFFHRYHIDIHSSKYQTRGTSKANKTRAFWDQEPDQTVADVLSGLLDIYEQNKNALEQQEIDFLKMGRSIVAKLYGRGRRSILHGKGISDILDSEEMKRQIEQIDEYIEKNPAEAIGKAKELMEACCKTILSKSGLDLVEYDQCTIPQLTRKVAVQLRLVPEGIPHQSQGYEAVKKVLGNLMAITQNIAELRNYYGTGHGRDHKFQGLEPRHARLVVGAAITYAEFITETFMKRYNHE